MQVCESGDDVMHTAGITCVMVTHDVELKSFAHRVLHMRDGKIGVEETISDDARSKIRAQYKAKADLIRATENKSHTKHHADLPDYDDDIDIEAGAVTSNTVFRQPHDYSLNGVCSKAPMNPTVVESENENGNRMTPVISGLVVM